MSFRVILDEQIPWRVAEALQNVELPVEHVTRVAGLGTGAVDLVILEHCRRSGDVLVTLDHGMTTRPQEREAIREEGVGAFVMRSGRKTHLLPREILSLLLSRWEQIEVIITSESRPFLKRLQPNHPIRDYDTKRQRRKGASGKKRRKKKQKKRKAR